MSGRLQRIEQALTQIDPATFQNLCDAYLSLRETGLTSFNRPGSQLGKIKTTKGTPDTFFRLKNGGLGYVEYTTRASKLYEKIIEDIEKCLDPSYTGVPKNEISKIVYVFNGRLKPAEEHAIHTFIALHHIVVELVSIDWLAIEILNSYPRLAKEFLSIPIDTGQILPLDKFIEEYNNKGGMVGTPLDNAFLAREKEMKELAEMLAHKDIVILEGAPGVGKTKLALEAIDRYVRANPACNALAISKKDEDIFDDLHIQLKNTDNYILLVDDANRQRMNFQQLMGFYTERKKGSLKLLITVRNYALQEVRQVCSEYACDELTINRFSDDEIKAIITSPEFNVVNPEFQNRILQIAEGNPRLAVMAARLAHDQPNKVLYGSLTDLYDAYFETFVKDATIFSNPVYLKTLGLISFFFTINRTDKDFVTKLLADFDLDYNSFNEAITALHERELVEIQYNLVRISEQVMATYFFFRAFIKDELLSFRTLMFNYFPVWKRRFSDSIIPSHNMFGPQEILDKISPVLDEYQQSVSNDPEKTDEYFNLFWFYKRAEQLAYLHGRITAMPVPEQPNYSTDYNRNDFVWNREKILEQLDNYFRYPIEEYTHALELAFEYTKRNPEMLPELVHNIKENIRFDVADRRNGFTRQVKLFELLIRKTLAGEPHYISAFYALSTSFLAHQYQITKSGRNNSISFYQYAIPLDSTIMEFRKGIWQMLHKRVLIDQPRVKKILLDFRPGIHEPNKDIWQFDLDFYLPMIEEILNPADFNDIEWVNQFIERMGRIGIDDTRINILKEKFKNPDYDYLQKLDWNYSRGKSVYDVTSYQQFRELKEKQLREDFRFSNIHDADPLFRAITSAMQMEDTASKDLRQSLDIIIEENFLRDPDMGFSLLARFMNPYAFGSGLPPKTINAIVTSSKEYTQRLLKMLDTWNHDQKDFWKIFAFAQMDETFIDETLAKSLLDTVDKLQVSQYFDMDALAKFEKVHAGILVEMLKLIFRNNLERGANIQLPSDFVEKFAVPLQSHFDLLVDIYFQQEKISNHFDFQKTGLKALMSIQPAFFVRYIERLFPENSVETLDMDTYLGFIWSLNIAYEVIEKVADRIIANTFAFLDHELNILFANLPESSIQAALKFLYDYGQKNSMDTYKINAVVNVICHSFPDSFDDFIIQYLGWNAGLEDFKAIQWIGTGGVYSGDFIIGDFRAGEWHKVLNAVKRFPEAMTTIPIIAYIQSQITEETKAGEYERQRKFSDPKA